MVQTTPWSLALMEGYPYALNIRSMRAGLPEPIATNSYQTTMWPRQKQRAQRSIDRENLFF